MKEKGIWYGFLDAGDRSSAVLRDAGLDTANPRTTYLYNLARNAILEYNLEIVGSKLRELKDKETDLIKALDEGYREAKSAFQARGAAKPARTQRNTASISKIDLDDIDDASNDENEDEDESSLAML